MLSKIGINVNIVRIDIVMSKITSIAKTINLSY
jgi:hypothetical protein